MKPTVEIDQGSGFCFGVVTAIRKAEEVLGRGAGCIVWAISSITVPKWNVCADVDW